MTDGLTPFVHSGMLAAEILKETLKEEGLVAGGDSKRR